MASGGEADVGLRLRLLGRQDVRRDLRDTRTDLEDVAAEVRGLASDAAKGAKGLAGLVDDKIQKGLKGVADGAKQAGVALATGIAAGVAAAGIAVGAALGAAISKGIEQQNTSRDIAALTGLSLDDAAEAGAIAGRIYAQNYGETRDEVAAALVAVSSAGGSPITDLGIQDATKAALNLASVFDVEVGESARAAGQLVRTGLVANLGEAYNLITDGFQSGANRGDDLLDTLNEYSTTFEQAGLSGQQALGLISQSMEAGVLNSDFAADAIRETGIRVREMSEDTAGALQTLGLDASAIGEDFNAGGDRAAAAMDTVFDALRTTTDEGVRNAAGAAIIGSQYEDLGDALLAMDPSTAVAALGNIDDAAANLDATLASGLAPAWETARRSAENLLYGAGTAIVDQWGPNVEGVLGRVSGGLNTLAEDFPGLGGDIAALVQDGNITAIGTRLEEAFGLPAGSIAGLQTGLDTFIGKVQAVWAGLQPLLGALTDFAEHKINLVLPLLSSALGFVADHAETFRAGLYTALIMLGLFKGVMLAVNIGLKVKAGLIALSTARLALNTAAQRAANSNLVTGLRLKGMEAAAWIRSTAATVANRIAVTASSVATKAAAAGQWLLNAAMSANPIGLVILAVTALVGGLVWFFTQTELGQKIFTGAWNGIKDAAAWVADWFTGTLVPWLGGAWDSITGAVGDAVKWITDKWDEGKRLLMDVATGIANGLRDAWTGVKDGARDAFDAVVGFISKPLDKAQEFIEKIAQLADDLTGGAFSKLGEFLGFGPDDPEGRATGGTVSRNTPYLVGEEGAELFVPGVSGSVMPSDALRQMMGAPVPQVRSAAVPTVGDDGDDFTDSMTPLTLTVHVDVDGTTIATAAVNGMHANAAWK